MSFRYKIILGVAFIEAMMLALLVWNGLHILTSSNERELIKRAKTTTMLFATTNKDALLSSDIATLESLIEEVLTNPGIVYTRVLDRDGMILAQGGDETILTQTFEMDSHYSDVKDGVFDAFANIEEADVVYGRIEIGFSIHQIDAVIADAQRKSLAFACVGMVLSALFSLILGIYLTRSINHLREGAQKISDGQLGYQIEVRGRDELAAAAKAFNDMSLKLYQLETQRNQAEEELREKEERFRSVVESATNAIISSDNRGHIVSWNHAAENIFGYAYDEIEGKPITSIMPERFQEAHRTGITRFTSKEQSNVMGKVVELVGLKKNGTEFPVELSLATWKTRAGTFFTGILRDITERKLSEKELQEYAEKLKQSNQELQNFVYIASHDLQEPLRKIQTFGDMLKVKYCDTIDNQGSDYLERMRKATERMRILIEGLLTFSRVSTKAQPFIPVNLDTVTREVLSDLEIRIEEVNGRVEVGDLPTIDADPLQMPQLFQNLIGNALKFNRKDKSPIVKVDSIFVDPAGQPSNNTGMNGHYQITIEDNGIGFDEKYADRIFGVFQRLHGRTEYEGAGIGLSVCKKIVERHGGKIEAKSQAGEGAIFIITLPLKQVKEKSNNG